MKTAEWQCTVCGVTNRKLIPDASRRATDRCVTCHTAHLIEQNDRPVRWDAKSGSKRPLTAARVPVPPPPLTSPPARLPSLPSGQAPTGEGSLPDEPA